jgi:hypothetical protein
MAAITAMGTTYNLPNYTGLLYQIAPSDTPFLSAIGGINGGGQTVATEFEWETFDFDPPAQNVQLEGANAPTAQERVRANVTNIVEIHQKVVSVSYSKQAAFGQHAGVNNEAQNPIRNEVDWQTTQALKQMVLDLEWSFLNGTYQKPSDNTTARQTRGLLNAIQTNKQAGAGVAVTGATSATDTITTGSAHGLSVGNKVVFRATGGATGIVVGRIYYVVNVGSSTTFKVSGSSGGTPITLGTASNISYVGASATDLTKDQVNALAQQVYDAGGISDLDNATFLVNSAQKVQVSKAFGTQFFEQSRTVGGTAVSTVVTDFGTINVMLSRRIPQDTIALASLEVCQPVFLEVPGKGHFFAEPLAKVGASDQVQIYGEAGLAYGPETAHGLLTGLKF